MRNALQQKLQDLHTALTQAQNQQQAILQAQEQLKERIAALRGAIEVLTDLLQAEDTKDTATNDLND